MSDPQPESNTDLSTDSTHSLRRRSLIAGSASTIMFSLSGCSGFLENETDATLEGAYFKITKDDNSSNAYLDFYLEFDSNVPDEAVQAISVGGEQSTQHSDNEFAWGDNYTVTDEQVNELATTDLSGESVNVEALSELTTDRDGALTEDDNSVIGRVENVYESWRDPEVVGTILSVPEIVFDGEADLDAGAVRLQLPDGQLHHFPEPEYGTSVDAYLDDRSHEFGLTVTPDANTASITYGSGGDTEVPLQVDPPTLGESSSDGTILVPVYEHGVILHPALGTLSSIWDTIGAVLLGIEGDLMNSDELQAEVSALANDFAVTGVDAAVSPIGDANPDSKAPFTNYTPLDSQMGVAMQGGEATARTTLNLIDIVSTAKTMNDKINAFDGSADELSQVGALFKDHDASGFPWGGAGVLARFISLSVVPHMATATSPQDIRDVEAFLNATTAYWSLFERIDNAFENLTQSKQAEYTPIRGFFNTARDAATLPDTTTGECSLWDEIAGAAAGRPSFPGNTSDPATPSVTLPDDGDWCDLGSQIVSTWTASTPTATVDQALVEDTLVVGYETGVSIINPDDGNVFEELEGINEVSSVVSAAGYAIVGTGSGGMYRIDPENPSLDDSMLTSQVNELTSDGETVYGTGDGVSFAYDATNASFLWEVDVGGHTIDVDGNRLVVAEQIYTHGYGNGMDYTVTCLDIASGNDLWERTHKLQRKNVQGYYDTNVLMTPIENGQVYVVEGHDHAGSWGSGGTPYTTLFAVDADTGENIWEYDVHGAFGEIVVGDGTVFAVLDKNMEGEGFLLQVMGEDGSPLYRFPYAPFYPLYRDSTNFRTPGSIGRFYYPSIAYADGELFLGGEFNGDLSVGGFDVDSRSVTWDVPAGQRDLIDPVVAGDWVVYRHETGVTAFTE